MLNRTIIIWLNISQFIIYWHLFCYLQILQKYHLINYQFANSYSDNLIYTYYFDYIYEFVKLTNL